MNNFPKYSIPEAIGLVGGRQVPLRTDANGKRPISLISSNSHGTPSFVGSQDALALLCNTAYVASPFCFPVSSFAHLFDEEFFSEAMPPETIMPKDQRLARLGCYLAVGELFVYLNENRTAPPSHVASQYARTFMFAAARSRLLDYGVEKLPILLDRWLDVRRLTGSEPSSLLPPDKIDAIAAYWFGGGNGFSWADELRSGIPTMGDGALVNRAASIVNNRFGLSLPPLPAAFDARFEWLATAVARLRAATADSEDAEFGIGILLAMIEPGELMHLNWLRRFLGNFPGAALHYAGWSALLSWSRAGVSDVFNGLVTRLARDLIRPFHRSEPPMEDISWLDLSAAGEPIDEVNTRTGGRSLRISLVPGVIVGASLQIHADGGTASKAAQQHRHEKTDSVLRNRAAQEQLFAVEKDASSTSEEMLHAVLEQLAYVRNLLEKPKKKVPRKASD